MQILLLEIWCLLFFLSLSNLVFVVAKWSAPQRFDLHIHSNQQRFYLPASSAKVLPYPFWDTSILRKRDSSVDEILSHKDEAASITQKYSPTVISSNTGSQTLPISSIRHNVTISINNGNMTQPQGLYFHTDLNCNITDTIVCQQLADTIVSAAMKVTKELHLRHQIRMNVVYRSYCKRNCRNETLGWAAPSAQWTLPGLQGVDPNYLYAQSLAKQLSPLNLRWSDYDIYAEFNHDLVEKIYLTNTIPSAIQANQLSMEYIILHEIIHGLGFVSSWAPYFLPPNSIYSPLLSPPMTTEQLQLLTPPPLVHQDPETNLTRLSGFLPSSIFDKFLIVNAPPSKPYPLEKIGNLIRRNCYEGNGTLVNQFVQSLLNDSEVYRAAQSAWNIAGQKNVISLQYPPPPNTFSNMSATEFASYLALGGFTNLADMLHSPSLNLTIYTSPSSQVIEAQLPDDSPANATEASAGEILLLKGHTLFTGLSSFSHLDPDIYTFSEDFLMRPGVLENFSNKTGPWGTSLDALTTRKPTNSELKASAIGPGTLRVLELMGYSTFTQPRSLPANSSSNTLWQPHKRKCAAAPLNRPNKEDEDSSDIEQNSGTLLVTSKSNTFLLAMITLIFTVIT
ncbi:uncharacterized protein VTP21DRAFT_567 [Calcarisporiella thermophila]|uniref:uncharacterized protein n=1 Tax=Calcarisporiella thermophila TaxID=911321 RepID=UPI0037438A08